jgi:predicted nucleic acid-binding protein
VKHRLREYRDRKIDLADACLIRLADEFETADILTLDKDFAGERTSLSKSY